MITSIIQLEYFHAYILYVVETRTKNRSKNINISLEKSDDEISYTEFIDKLFVRKTINEFVYCKTTERKKP